jgi:peptidoglycan/xylan/chitin deacetylase (PgdA/CDA1 family)
MMHKKIKFEVLNSFVFAVLILTLGLGPLVSIKTYSQLSYRLPDQQQEQQQSSEKQQNQDKIIITTRNESNDFMPSLAGHNNNKFVIINFDDSKKSQFTYAKLILDKYEFKATFFEICGIIGREGWKEVAALRDDGMDIESHTMDHRRLNNLTAAELSYEIGQSKQCFLDHGFNTTIFAYPFGKESHNATVVNVIAKYYKLARTNTLFPLTFLHCDKSNNQPTNQNDCRTYSHDGTLTLANRYSMNGLSPLHIQGDYSYTTASCLTICVYYNDSQMFDRFVAAVNSQNSYNNGAVVRAIPIIIYHNIVTYPDASYSKSPVDTTMILFDHEMKYLYENGFKVLTMSDLDYDENNNYLYIKNTSKIEDKTLGSARLETSSPTPPSTVYDDFQSSS